MITREEAAALAGAAAEHAEVLARTVVALYDERDAEVARGAHWRQAHDEADRLRDLAVAVADRAEQERDALARTVVALRADLDDKCSALTTAWDENARLALELRRLRAAEAPGTDDEAFSGTGWDWLDGAWVHVSGPVVGMDEEGLWTSDDVAQRNELALDAMRAAVPGSV